MGLIFTKKLSYEGFQYGPGDIAAITDSDLLNLYDLIDSKQDNENIVPKGNSFQKESIFTSVQEIKLKRT